MGTKHARSSRQIVKDRRPRVTCRRDPSSKNISLSHRRISLPTLCVAQFARDSSACLRRTERDRERERERERERNKKKMRVSSRGSRISGFIHGTTSLHERRAQRERANRAMIKVGRSKARIEALISRGFERGAAR